MLAGTTDLSIFGIPVTTIGSYADAVDLIGTRIAARQKTVCVALNPLKMYRASRDPVMRRMLAASDVRICDGVGISWATLLLHGRWTPRITGIQLFLELIARAEREGWRIFLLGASPESNAAARRKLLLEHPSLRIIGSRDGYFKDPTDVVNSINSSGADLLFVAMGSPRQELWISEQWPRLNVPFCMGIGGSLDAISGAAKWAPSIVRKTGTEWLFRLISRPSMFPRLIIGLLFAMDIVKAAAANLVSRPSRQI